MQAVVGVSCPDCGAVVAVDVGWVSWCDRCGWNAVTPQPTTIPSSAFARLLDLAGASLGERLAQELKERDSLEPRPTAAKIAAFSIAAMIELLAIGVVGAAFLLAALTFPNVFALVLAVAMLGFAWLIRPRLGKAPTRGLVSRSEAPELYGLLDQVANALTTGPPDLVVIDEEVNASWSMVGIRRQRVLRLGLPLLAVLTPQQRVALVAHELAHGRNGDVRRSMIVTSALNTLSELYRSLLPGASLLTFSSFGILDYLGRGLMWLAAQPIKWLLLLELHLLLRDMQRAEYLADALAAEVAGTEATTELHERLLLNSVIELTIQHAARDHLDPEQLFEAIHNDLAAVPERERQRRLRAAALEQTKLDDTHPPTAMRIELLQHRPPRTPNVLLDDESSHTIDLELAPQRTPIGRRLIDQHRASLYR